LVALLRHAGYRARAAYGGQSALALAEHYQPQVVVRVIEMHRLNGYAAANVLRRLVRARTAADAPPHDPCYKRKQQAACDCTTRCARIAS
jgi:CheY-like chemotaxis protein